MVSIYTMGSIIVFLVFIIIRNTKFSMEDSEKIIALQKRVNILSADYSNYEKDFLYLNNLIKEKVAYNYELNIVNKTDNKVISDKDLNEMVIKINKEVDDYLNEDYLQKLKILYNKNIENYVTEQIFLFVLKLSKDANSKTIKKLNFTN